MARRITMQHPDVLHYRAPSAWCQAPQNTQYAFVSMDPPADPTAGAASQETPRNNSKRFIRLFKDEMDPDLWWSYCVGVGLNPRDPNLKSFKIYIESYASIDKDQYDANGQLLDD